jgi:FG-GAP-like repeat
MKARSLALKIVVAALALTTPCLWAQDGLEGALARVNLTAPVNLATPFSQTLAAADFDGDNKPDGAILLDHDWLRPQSRLRTIELHFTGRGNTTLIFESSETTLAISALDVNGDGATDIVVEQQFTHKRLQVWLNDGRGSFRKVRSEDFPSADAGNCERLEPPSQRVDDPTPCLPPQRGSEIAILTACPLPYRSHSGREQASPIGSPIVSRAVAPNSPRAPPLLQSL